MADPIKLPVTVEIFALQTGPDEANCDLAIVDASGRRLMQHEVAAALNATAPAQDPVGPDWQRVEKRLNAYVDSASREQLLADIGATDAQAPVAGLDDEALSVVDLATVFMRGEEAAEAAGEDGLHGGIRAVMDHVLHTLAGMAGEPEALDHVAAQALANHMRQRGAADHDMPMWSDIMAVAQAVSVAAVAPVALELLRARAALDELDRSIPLPTSSRCAKAMSAALPHLRPLPTAVQDAVAAHDQTLIEQLAAEAGDIAALAIAFTKATGPAREADESGTEAGCQAVAARVWAAAESRERGLREALRKLNDIARRVYTSSGQDMKSWCALTVWFVEGESEGGMGDDTLVATPDVGRVEAEARLGERMLAVVTAAREMDAHPCHATHSDDCPHMRLRKALHDLDNLDVAPDA